MGNLSKKTNIYRAPASGNMPTQRSKVKDEHGRYPVEKVSKLKGRKALNSVGNIVHVALTNGPAQTWNETEGPYGTGMVKRLQKLGMVFVDECPVETGALGRTKTVELFGSDAEPCDPDENFDEYKPCVHIRKLQTHRRGEHEAVAKLGAVDAKSLEQLLKEQLKDNLVKEMKVAAGAGQMVAHDGDKPKKRK